VSTGRHQRDRRHRKYQESQVRSQVTDGVSQMFPRA
jgi:hypothetical protein